MSCKDTDYYIETYVPYPLKFASNSGFVITDVTDPGGDIKAVLRSTQNQCTKKEYTYLGGGITVVSGVLVVQIESTDIITKGNYDWTVTLTKASTGKLRGLHVNPSRITFN